MPNLVYPGSGHEVKTVMVAGVVLVCDGEVLVADPVHKEMALLQAMEAGQL